MLHARERPASRAHLQVGRVGQQRQVHALAAGGRPVVGRAQVILDVARAKVLLALPLGPHAGKLAEDLAQRLAHHVCQHVQAACSGTRPRTFMPVTITLWAGQAKN